MILCLAIVDCSTLITTGVDTVKMFWVGCVIDLVCHGLLVLLFSGTLEISGSDAVVVGVAAMASFWWISLSVI